MICAACKHRCICEAQARGRKRDSQTDQHDGDLWHMCRRTTGEGRWEDQVRRFDRAGHRHRCGAPRKRDRRGSAKAADRPEERPAQLISRQASAMLLQWAAAGKDEKYFWAALLLSQQWLVGLGGSLAKGCLVLIGRPRRLRHADHARLDPDDSARSRMAHELGVAVETGQENKNSNPPALWFFWAVAVGLRRAFRAFGLRNYLPE